MSDEEKRYEREWSFSFDKLNDQISDFVRSFGVSGEASLQTDIFSEPIGPAQRAQCRFDLPVGETKITSITGDNLIEAELTHLGDVRFAVSGETEKMVSLGQNTDAADWVRNLFGWIGAQGKLNWSIGLTNSIPLDLDIHSGVGNSTFDLRGLDLTKANVYGGAGDIDLTLPVGTFPVQLSGGIGKFVVNVPAGATIDLSLRAGTGTVELNVGANATVTARIKGGVGDVTVNLPAASPVQVDARMGLGDVNLPDRLVRVSGDSDTIIGKSGVWQTPDYEANEQRIMLDFDGGVGGLLVQFA